LPWRKSPDHGSSRAASPDCRARRPTAARPAFIGRIAVFNARTVPMITARTRTRGPANLRFHPSIAVCQPARVLDPSVSANGMAMCRSGSSRLSAPCAKHFGVNREDPGQRLGTLTMDFLWEFGQPDPAGRDVGQRGRGLVNLRPRRHHLAGAAPKPLTALWKVRRGFLSKRPPRGTRNRYRIGSKRLATFPKESIVTTTVLHKTPPVTPA
jgi:hypothetical protein